MTFGYIAPIGSTIEFRERLIPLHLDPAWAARLLDARCGRSAEHPDEVLARAATGLYFHDGGRRAHRLDVEITGIDCIAARF